MNTYLVVRQCRHLAAVSSILDMRPTYPVPLYVRAENETAANYAADHLYMAAGFETIRLDYLAPVSPENEESYFKGLASEMPRPYLV